MVQFYQKKSQNSKDKYVQNFSDFLYCQKKNDGKKSKSLEQRKKDRYQEFIRNIRERTVERENLFEDVEMPAEVV